MTWTAITGDILLQDGTGAFLFTAGGTILQGQAVGMSANDTVKSGSTGAQYDCVGVALYDATVGEEVAIAGPGNIVYCENDAYDAAGTLLYPGADGILCNTAGSATKIAGIVVASGTTTAYKQKVLLL